MLYGGSPFFLIANSRSPPIERAAVGSEWSITFLPSMCQSIQSSQVS